MRVIFMNDDAYFMLLDSLDYYETHVIREKNHLLEMDKVAFKDARNSAKKALLQRLEGEIKYD